MITPTRRRLGFRLALLAAIIAAGLGLRAFGYAIGLPFTVVKYGGSVLWGAMVYAGVDIVLTLTLGRPRYVLTVAVGFAAAVEFLRLVHTSWLDAFRLTPAGTLLLGRVFSPWNLVAYAVGIATIALLERLGAVMLRGSSLYDRPRCTLPESTGR
ncbi:MAG: DUF2809 domain-containing protein [Burkholderiales bacterium]|nr:DUF2809 domain-containing protein [Burkholderiales bacterium]